MDNRIWYMYQSQKQMGPFELDQVQQLYNNNMISEDAYVFKVGWKDWRPIEECYNDLGVPPASGGSGEGVPEPEKIEKRRASAPRASIKGRVDVHNGAQFSAGIGVNISSTGIFVETRDKIFNVGEALKLTVRCDALSKPFNVTAMVIRFNSDDNFPVGYGLKFEDLPAAVQLEIDDLVNESNTNSKLSVTGSV